MIDLEHTKALKEQWEKRTDEQRDALLSFLLTQAWPKLIAQKQ